MQLKKFLTINNMHTVKEHIANTSTRYIQHPLAPRDVYVELKRDKDGKATHFITHYRNVSKEERIDDRSHYDKSPDSAWKVIDQKAVDAIIASKAASNAKPAAAIATVIPVKPTPAPVVGNVDGIIDVVKNIS